MSTSAAIEVSGLWKQYQTGVIHHRLGEVLTGWFSRRAKRPGEAGVFWALQDVSFQVAAGETLGIIGRNGAGKSTALKLLSGITKPTQGRIDIRGRLAALIEVGAGFHPDLTGRENVYLNGTILGLKRREIDRLFDRIVAFSELERFIDTPVKRYSSGMYVRLGFAIAVHIDPDVLLIDEVLAVGDLAFQQKCLQRIHEMKRAGRTIVFISHNLNAVQRICDRAILLTAGRVTAEGDVASVIRTYREQVLAREQQRFQRVTTASAATAEAPLIDAVRLRDGNLEATDTVTTGEPLTVDVAYACPEPIEQPVVTVTIERLDGLVCHQALAGRDDDVWPALEGRGVLRVTYPRLELLPNSYGVSVEITQASRATPLDSRKFVSLFTVVSDGHEVGVVHLDHHWERLGPQDGTAEGGAG